MKKILEMCFNFPPKCLQPMKINFVANDATLNLLESLLRYAKHSEYKSEDLAKMNLFEMFLFACNRVEVIPDVFDAVMVDKSLKININVDLAALVVSLRNAFDVLFARFVTFPQRITQNDRAIQLLKDCMFMFFDKSKNIQYFLYQ